MAPYLDKLKASLESRFTELDLLAAFNVLNPRTMINKDLEEKSVADLKLLANHFPSIDEAALLSEWLGFKVLVASGSLKVSNKTHTQSVSQSVTHSQTACACFLGVQHYQKRKKRT